MMPRKDGTTCAVQVVWQSCSSLLHPLSRPKAVPARQDWVAFYTRSKAQALCFANDPWSGMRTHQPSPQFDWGLAGIKKSSDPTKWASVSPNHTSSTGQLLSSGVFLSFLARSLFNDEAPKHSLEAFEQSFHCTALHQASDVSERVTTSIEEKALLAAILVGAWNSRARDGLQGQVLRDSLGNACFHRFEVQSKCNVKEPGVAGNFHLADQTSL